MLQYRCDDQGGPQPPPNWKEPKPEHKPENPEEKPEEEKPAA